MRVAMLWTGGKDSALAYHRAKEQHNVVLFVNFIWNRPPLSHPRALAKLQMEAIEKPFLSERVEPPYFESYRESILYLKERYGIQAVVTGDIAYIDAFHGNWMDAVCSGTEVGVIKPLWECDRQKLLDELLTAGFEAVFSCAKEPWLNEKWIGRRIDDKSVSEMKKLHQTKGLDLCGENGEYHTMIMDAPFFTKTISVASFKTQKTENCFVMEPIDVSLRSKPT